MAIQLNKREKLVVWAAGIMIGLLILLKGGGAYLEVHKKWNRQVEAKKVILSEMGALKSEYDNFKQLSDHSRNRLEKRGKGFSLFAFLNDVSDKVKIKEHLAYMKPSTIERKGIPYKIDVVEMKFSQVTLKQLAQYLHSVETSGNQVIIKRSSISTSSRKKGYLDVTLLIETVG